MNLLSAPKNQLLEVVSISNNKLQEDALRFGIEEGNFIEIINKMPSGPIVVQKNEMQIAIGQELARAIEVKIKS